MKTQKTTIDQLVYRVELGEWQSKKLDNGNEQLVLRAHVWAVKVGWGWETFIVCEHCWYDDDGDVFHYWEGTLNNLRDNDEWTETLENSIRRRVGRREGRVSVLSDQERELMDASKSYKYYPWDSEKYEDKQEKARFDDDNDLYEILQMLKE